MLKKNVLTVLFFMLLCLFVFRVSAQVVPTENGGLTWNILSSGNDGFVIEIDVPDGFTQKTELTLPCLRYKNPAGDEVQIASVPSASEYTNPDFSGRRSWSYRLKDLKYPFRILLSVQACSEDGMCFAPEQLEIGPFESEEGLLEFCELEAVQTESDSEKNPENSDESASGGIDRNLMKTEENMVMLPDFEILCAGSGYRQPGEFLNFLKGDNDDTGIYYFLNEEAGFFLKLILALLGGLALNLTPCVLPLFPVNLAVIGASYSESDSDPGKNGKKRVMRGVCYSLGILVTYTVLGVLCSAAGASVGRWSAMPAFRLGASVIFLILGLSMFGIVHLDLSRFRNGIPFQPGKSGWGVFFLGCLTAALAGACVSPVLAAVLVYTAQMCREGDFLKSILLPAFMGLGFALPWPFLQAGLNFLPKPGKWMKYVNGVFGSLLLIAAVYYGWSGVKGMTYTPDPAVSDPEEMVYDLRNALDFSAQTEKPVFVKFTASWCADCRAMERTTYTDPDVSRELDKCVVLELNMEHPEHPVCRQLLELFDFHGFPSYALIKE